MGWAAGSGGPACRAVDSVSLVTDRDDYTDDEWTVLLTAPRIAGAFVVVSDLHVTGMLGEFKALALALTDRAADGADNRLVQSLIDAMGEAGDDDQDDEPEAQDLDELRGVTRDLLVRAASIVDVKAATDEAVGYRRWIRAAATATAEARKESSFFGVGGERVSDAERTALAEIASALGTTERG